MCVSAYSRLPFVQSLLFFIRCVQNMSLFFPLLPSLPLSLALPSFSLDE